MTQRTLSSNLKNGNVQDLKLSIDNIITSGKLKFQAHNNHSPDKVKRSVKVARRQPIWRRGSSGLHTGRCSALCPVGHGSRAELYVGPFESGIL
jgi:hypothetical protein